LDYCCASAVDSINPRLQQPWPMLMQSETQQFHFYALAIRTWEGRFLSWDCSSLPKAIDLEKQQNKYFWGSKKPAKHEKIRVATIRFKIDI
jgi:hypothetical protein